MRGFNYHPLALIQLFFLLAAVDARAFSSSSWWGKSSSLQHKRGLSRRTTTTATITTRLRAGGNWNDGEEEEEDDSTRQPPNKILIVMDAFCPYHGGYLIREAEEAGLVRVIPVLGDYLRNFLLRDEPENNDLKSSHIPTTPEQVEEWKQTHGLDDSTEIAAVYCESDSGLEDAERLRQVLNVSCQDNPIVSSARRDKYLMNEQVQKYGLATAQQKLCSSSSEACAFAQELLSSSTSKEPRVVVKPIRGVASESVHLCHSQKEVQDAWKAITETTVFGATSSSKHDTVLVQEYLEGPEYALDVVSRNGEHKIAAVWKYDKRPANGAPFVYFQTRLVDAGMEPENVPRIQAYVRQALDALGIRYGLTHNEVILTSDRGPVLVEVNHRQHNMDFLPLVMACIGYNCLDMTLEALTGKGEFWDMLPHEPELRAHGCMVHLVNFAEKGILCQVLHLNDMSELPSFFQGHVYDQFQAVGEEIEPTVDIRSDAGFVQLINPDAEELENDYEQIVKWMPTMFEVEEDT